MLKSAFYIIKSKLITFLSLRLQLKNGKLKIDWKVQLPAKCINIWKLKRFIFCYSLVLDPPSPTFHSCFARAFLYRIYFSSWVEWYEFSFARRALSNGWGRGGGFKLNYYQFIFKYFFSRHWLAKCFEIVTNYNNSKMENFEADSLTLV